MRKDGRRCWSEGRGASTAASACPNVKYLLQALSPSPIGETAAMGYAGYYAVPTTSIRTSVEKALLAVPTIEALDCIAKVTYKIACAPKVRLGKARGDHGRVCTRVVPVAPFLSGAQVPLAQALQPASQQAHRGHAGGAGRAAGAGLGARGGQRGAAGLPRHRHHGPGAALCAVGTGACWRGTPSLTCRVQFRDVEAANDALRKDLRREQVAAIRAVGQAASAE